MHVRRWITSRDRRKKDHGRAEALLIAAWASGSIPAPQVRYSIGSASTLFRDLIKGGGNEILCTILYGLI